MSEILARRPSTRGGLDLPAIDTRSELPGTPRDEMTESGGVSEAELEQDLKNLLKLMDEAEEAVEEQQQVRLSLCLDTSILWSASDGSEGFCVSRHGAPRRRRRSLGSRWVRLPARGRGGGRGSAGRCCWRS